MAHPKYHSEMLQDPWYIDLVASLRQAREAAGLSQAELAQKLEVTWASVSRWERRVTFPSLYCFIRWLKVLGFEAKEKA